MALGLSMGKPDVRRFFIVLIIACLPSIRAMYSTGPYDTEKLAIFLSLEVYSWVRATRAVEPV